MKLARKIAAALILAILVVMAGYAYVQIRQEVVLFESDLKQNARRGHALVALVQSVWRTEGEERTRELVEVLAQVADDVDVRWVRADAPSGDPLCAAHPRGAAEATRTGVPHEIHSVDDAGDHHRHLYLPLALGEPKMLEISESMQRETAFIRTSHRAIAGATILVATICGLVAMGLGIWLVGRPIKLLRDKARRVGAGDFSGRLVVRQRDEIGELATEINTMCDQLAAATERLTAETDARMAALEQLRHSERLATVGQLASGVAHELGTPLNVVAARARMIATHEGARPAVVEHAAIIEEQATRMTGIIRQLLDFSRRRGPQLSSASLPDIVVWALDLLSATAKGRGVTLDFVRPAEPMPVRVDQNQIRQTLTNVILNGIQSMPRGGHLRVRLATRRARPPGGQEGDYVAVTIEDDGAGISPEHLPHLFEPFFTTKGPGEGTGLGLAVAHGIVTEHGGWIEVESQVGVGTRFTILLPRDTGVETGRMQGTG